VVINLLRELVPVLFCLYAADCVSLLRGGELVFVSFSGRRFRVLTRRLFVAPVLPEGMAFRALRTGILLGPSGAFLPGKQTIGSCRFRSSSYDFVPYESLAPAKIDGRSIQVAGHSIQAPSPEMAQRAADTLASLARTPESRRASAVQEISRADGNPRSARRCRRILFLEAQALRDPSWTLFLLLFVLLPICTYVEPLAPYAPLALLACGVSYAVVVVLAFRSRRRFISRSIPMPPGATTALVLSPPSAARASVNLLKSGFEGFDPFVVASILLTGSQFALLLEAERHGSQIASEEDAGPDWRTYWTSRLALCEALSVRMTLGKDDAPSKQRADSQSVGLCVFCRAEYTDSSIDYCNDCDFPLRRLLPDPRKSVGDGGSAEFSSRT